MDDSDPGAGLDRLPRPGAHRVAVRITADALRQVRAGHPWVFDRSIESVRPAGGPGDLAVVFDPSRRFAAIGLWDPDSPIRVRVLHAGRPRPIDARFWRDRIESAAGRRRELIDDADTTGFRCIHGENDGLPGLVVDRYDSTAVVKVYTSAWLPHLHAVVPIVQEIFGVDRVVLRHGRAVPAPDGPVTLVGRLPDGPVEFLERGLRFEADVVAGQKTGHFLDQRENRALVGGIAAGADVLDVFCCTGGFTVHAAAGGARSVLSVDQSGHALATTERNLAHNRQQDAVRRCRHATRRGDAFEILRDLGRSDRRYDLVVIDPPSFASRASQVDRAIAAYRTLTRLGLDVVRPGGMLVQSSCSSRVDEVSFHGAVRAEADATGRRLAEWARTGHAADHPVGFPEGAYLKTVFGRVDP